MSTELFDVETFGKERALLTKVTKAWRDSAPPGAPFLFSFSSFVSLLLVWWWVLRPEFVFVFFVIFLGGSDVRWLCLVGIVLS